MVSSPARQSESTTTPARLQFSLRSLLLLISWCSFILAIIVSEMSMSYRISFAIIVTCPICVAWRGSIYNAALLGGVAAGISVGILVFLGLCAAGQLEAFYGLAASSVTLGIASGVTGWFLTQSVHLVISKRIQH
jgi:hypothetical protein